jgi:hypothetical protein
MDILAMKRPPPERSTATTDVWIVTAVHIQRYAAEALERDLIQAGMTVSVSPFLNPVRPPTVAEIWYYYPGDRKLAEIVRASAQKLGIRTELVAKKANLFETGKVTVWFPSQ